MQTPALFLSDDLDKRPRLNLKPRSKPSSDMDQVAANTARLAIFGEGKPRDEKVYKEKSKERKESNSSDDVPPST